MIKKLRLLGLALIAALALGVVPVSGAQAATLISDNDSATNVTGHQYPTHGLVLRDNSNLSWTCTVASQSGSIPKAGTSSLLMHPWYEGCTAFGLKATVNTSGCNYRYNLAASSGPEFPATMDIECSTSGIVLTTLTCELVFPPQTGISGVTLTNVSTGTGNYVRMDLSMEGIDYAVTKDGIGCPMKAKGNYSEAAYGGATRLEIPSGNLRVEP